jgi:ribosomal protein S18 acetylase RimI-like enzyme
MLIVPTVRLALPSDARGIAEFSRDYIEHGLSWSWNRDRILKAIRDTATNVAVVHERDDILGFGIMQYGETTAHLCLLGVQPTLQCRGLGGALLSWLECCAVTAGIECVKVEARADNPRAIAFYEKRGFKVEARVPGYYCGIIDAVRLRKRLTVGSDRAGKLPGV